MSTSRWISPGAQGSLLTGEDRDRKEDTCDLRLHFRAGPVFVVSVPRRSSLVAAHVLPLSPGPGAAWNLEAEAKYIR